MMALPTPVPFPKGTVRVAFDNNQIIGKTYTIRAENKVPSSIMTTTMYAKISEEELQIQNDLAPSSGCGENLIRMRGISC